MDSALIALDPRFVIAPVNRRTFGSFVEHVGRGVYSGIFEPGHPQADKDGYRRDVLELVREMGVSTVRYPGGNFVSGYRWEDGTGPHEHRPSRLDLGWHCTEPNTFGTDEFLEWTELAGVEPMMAVNLGTRGIAEALDLLEYVNGPKGSALADQRRSNGREEPYDVRMWCLGNEVDGPWQVGHKTATEYGRLAAETARAMRMFDPNLLLVAAGSSGPQMPTFASWEREVLEQCYELVDFISIHRYYENDTGDLPSFLASAVDLERYIDAVVATVDHVKAATKSTHRVDLSLDEWNVWYQSRVAATPPSGKDWPLAPSILEDNYTVADAVVVGSMMITLLRHSDRVTSANQAQLVNAIAPIMTAPGGAAWRQTTFYPFAQMSSSARGKTLRVEPLSPTFHTDEFGDVAAIDAAATWDESTATIAMFVVNRDPEESNPVTIDATKFGQLHIEHATTLTDSATYAVNSHEHPTRVTPSPLQVTVLDGTAAFVAPPVSWTVITATAE